MGFFSSPRPNGHYLGRAQSLGPLFTHSGLERPLRKRQFFPVRTLWNMLGANSRNTASYIPANFAAQCTIARPNCTQFRLPTSNRGVDRAGLESLRLLHFQTRVAPSPHPARIGRTSPSEDGCGAHGAARKRLFNFLLGRRLDSPPWPLRTRPAVQFASRMQARLALQARASSPSVVRACRWQSWPSTAPSQRRQGQAPHQPEERHLRSFCQAR